MIIGAHAVLLVGWDQELIEGEIIKYWEVQNSWGEEWGQQGFFKIKIGDSNIASELFGGGFSCLPEKDTAK